MKRADETLSKEKILKKVRAALLQKGEFNADVDLDSDVFVKEEGEPIEIFAGNFLQNNGHFTFCFNEYHFLDQFLELAEEHRWQSIVCIEPYLQRILKSCDMPLLINNPDIKVADVSLTGCETLISRTGSVIVSSKENQSRSSTIFPPVHIVVAFRGQVMYDLKGYFATHTPNDYPSMTSIVSGPSRTADIEKTLVLGAHGPKQIFVFYIDQDKHLAEAF